ncbi:hypothetical protein BN1708_019266, partial [Verticillium longisporum]
GGGAEAEAVRRRALPDGRGHGRLQPHARAHGHGGPAPRGPRRGQEDGRLGLRLRLPARHHRRAPALCRLHGDKGSPGDLQAGQPRARQRHGRRRPQLLRQEALQAPPRLVPDSH